MDIKMACNIELYLDVLGAVATGLRDPDMQTALLSLGDDAVGTIAAPGVHLQAQQPNSLASREHCNVDMPLPAADLALRATCSCKPKVVCSF